VLVPAGIIELLTGHFVKGIGILLIQFVIISNIDNILKPRLVGQEARMHDLVIFFSIIGGVAAFGPLGVIVGPVIAALLVALMEIYGMEFKEYLHETGMLPAIREKDGLKAGDGE
jgi:predicted PurR-regulated permease PerM